MIEDYKNLGYANSWKEYSDIELIFRTSPVEYLKCINAGHELRKENIGKCQTQVFCDICKITWKYDSGD